MNNEAQFRVTYRQRLVGLQKVEVAGITIYVTTPYTFETVLPNDLPRLEIVQVDELDDLEEPADRWRRSLF